MADRLGQPLETLKMKDKKEIRCGHCNKLLGKGTAHDLEIKCPRCGTLNHLRDRIPGSEPSDGQNGAFYAGSEEKISH
ncbi:MULTISPECIES: Com family DNA-binding transcriptional regulator [Desulfovibrio]|uniref:Com family DNA-binding transcriptional regulator n=1 Tax=Desulfovibrio TaxID=872 RepID=UPI0026EB4C32|nr:Com family DNA-binding transcriptional regulator [Desulfovibrio piger]